MVDGVVSQVAGPTASGKGLSFNPTENALRSRWCRAPDSLLTTSNELIRFKTESLAPLPLGVQRISRKANRQVNRAPLKLRCVNAKKNDAIAGLSAPGAIVVHSAL